MSESSTQCNADKARPYGDISGFRSFCLGNAEGRRQQFWQMTPLSETLKKMLPTWVKEM